MDTFTSDYLIKLTTSLSMPIIQKVAWRFQEAWQGDESEQAMRRCLQAGVLGMISHASRDEPDHEALLADIFVDFFGYDEVATEVTRLVRLQPLDVDELLFLFQEAGYDAETLPGLQFPHAVAAFEAAFLEQAATESILQPIIQVHQGWAQTALQREMVFLMRTMVTALQAQADQPVGIQAGQILIINEINPTQLQPIFQWTDRTEAAAQTAETVYLKTLISRCNRLDLAEVDERLLSEDEGEVQLTDVFTTLYAAHGEQIIMRGSDQSAVEAIKGPGEAVMLNESRRQQEDKEAQPLTAVSAAGALNRLVVLGYPGGGKSTLVNYLATSLAKQRLTINKHSMPDWPDEPLLPVRIILRHFAAWLAATIGNDIPVVKTGLVWRYLQERLLDEWGCAEVYKHLKKTLQTKGGVIFFDGLDEVPQSEEDSRRTLIKQTILEFARPLDTCKIIVTCREYAYKKDAAWRLPPAKFPVIDLALFRDEQIRQFANTWYQVMGPRQGWSQDKQKREAQRLADAVIARPPLKELAQYPLLLTLMAQVHGRYHDLPENRADLYDRAVNLLLSHWENRLIRLPDGSQKVDPGLIERLKLRREDVRSVLEAIAFAAHERQEKQQNRDNQAADISRDELWEGLRPLVDDDYNRAKEVTDYIQERSGLLQAREGMTYAFPHRTFQEFLAAAYVWSLPEDPVEDLYVRLERDSSWWREIFLLAAGQERSKANNIKSMVERLVPKLPQTANVSKWQLDTAILAAQTLHETNFKRFVAGKDADHPYTIMVARIRCWLETALVDENNVSSIKRAEAGRALGQWIGDIRPGVGVDPQTGLPDIAWSAKEILAGEYTIGGKYGFEIQEVPINQPYRLARYPITNVQFQCFVDAPDRDEQEWWRDIPAGEQHFREPYFPYANHPRETVSWYQAVAFCRWLNAKLQAGLLQTEQLADGEYELRLPHEYEWEVAARWPNEDVQERIYPWGSEFDAGKANTWEGDRVGQTTAVGMYPSGRNVALELYDLSGNVLEWCGNKFDDPEDTAVDKSRRVLRGGSWDYNQNGARAAYRVNLNPDFHDYNIGFRVVLVRRSPSH